MSGIDIWPRTPVPGYACAMRCPALTELRSARVYAVTHRGQQVVAKLFEEEERRAGAGAGAGGRAGAEEEEERRREGLERGLEAQAR
eukprot:3030329-Rhodomonas_salina.4